MRFVRPRECDFLQYRRQKEARKERLGWIEFLLTKEKILSHTTAHVRDYPAFGVFEPMFGADHTAPVESYRARAAGHDGPRDDARPRPPRPLVGSGRQLSHRAALFQHRVALGPTLL